MTDVKPITKEERELAKEREIPDRFIHNNHDPIITIMWDVMDAYEARVKELEDALWWALSEIDGATRYDKDDQFFNCLDRARLALGGQNDKG